MSGPFRDGRPVPFSPSELEGADDLLRDGDPVDIGLARELESLAATSSARPSPGFADRVMAAVADEPAPAPVRAAGSAIRHHAGRALLASIRDAFRVVLGHGFPIVLRAQALALVLLVVALTAGSGMATAGAVGWLRDERILPRPQLSTPSPIVSVAPQRPTATGNAGPTDSFEPGDSADHGQGGVGTPEPGDSTDGSGTAGSTEGSGPGPVGESEQEGGGALGPIGPTGAGGGDGTGDGGGYPSATPGGIGGEGGWTPRPTGPEGGDSGATAQPTETPRPTESSHSGG